MTWARRAESAPASARVRVQSQYAVAAHRKTREDNATSSSVTNPLPANRHPQPCVIRLRTNAACAAPDPHPQFVQSCGAAIATRRDPERPPASARAADAMAPLPSH